MIDIHTILTWFEKLPITSWIVKLLKKWGFFRDYETLYRTEQKVKALGNAFKKIQVPIDSIIKEERITVPTVVVFRQKGGLLATTLKSKGFVTIGKSMGIYALPPLETKQAGITDGSSLNKWFVTQFALDSHPTTNIRFAALVDLADIFAYKHPSLKAETLFEAMMPHIIQYLGAEKTFQMTKAYYKKVQKTITEREIIDQTPLSHIFSDKLDNETFNRLQKAEEDMLADLISSKAIPNKSYLALSNINKSSLATCFINNVGHIADLDNVVDAAIIQAKFMADQL